MGKYNHTLELTGASDFHDWKSHVTLALGCEGIYNHVSDGTDPTDFAEFASFLPTPTVASTPTPTPTKAAPATSTTSAPTAAERKLIQDWLKEDAITKDIICWRLSPAVLQLIP